MYKGEILILFLQSLNEEDQKTFGKVENLQPVVFQVENASNMVNYVDSRASAGVPRCVLKVNSGMVAYLSKMS